MELLEGNVTQRVRSDPSVCLHTCLSFYTSVLLETNLDIEFASEWHDHYLLTDLSRYTSILLELTSGRCHWSCPWRSWLTCVDWVFQCDWTASWNDLRRSEPPEVFCPSRIAVEASSPPQLAGSAGDIPQSLPGLSAGQTCRNPIQNVQGSTIMSTFFSIHRTLDRIKTSSGCSAHSFFVLFY